jgi:VIT1/CCC1 family predicted Fe2+/Mn2+ transporter
VNNLLLILSLVTTGIAGLVIGFTIGWCSGLKIGRKQVKEEMEIERNF